MHGPSKWWVAGRVVAAMAVGVVVLVLLLPAGGIDTDPPQCYSTFDYSVPCGAGLAFGVAAVAVVGGWLGVGVLIRRRSSPDE